MALSLSMEAPRFLGLDFNSNSKHLSVFTASQKKRNGLATAIFVDVPWATSNLTGLTWFISQKALRP